MPNKSHKTAPTKANALLVGPNGKMPPGGGRVEKARPGDVIERDVSDFKLRASVREDSRGRVVIGDPKRHDKPDAYREYIGDHGEILLVPVREIPERELWLWQNPEAMAALDRGIAQVEAGQIRRIDLSTLPDDEA